MTIGVLRRDRTRRRLMEAARRLFTRLGYERTTVDEVAREAGYSKGAYYFHFASKEDVLFALVNEWVEHRSRLLEAAVDGNAPQVALTELLEVFLARSEAARGDDQFLLELWSQGERNSKVRHRLAQGYHSWHALLVRAFGQAQEACVLRFGGQPEAAASVALALHDGLVMQRCLRRPASSSWDAEAFDLLSAALRLTQAPSVDKAPAVEALA